MKKLLPLLLLVFTGCATIQPVPYNQQAYENVLNEWKGKDVNDLIMSWGAPTSTFTMPNGNRMFTWANVKIGPTITTHHGNVTHFDGITFSHSIAVSITPEWNCFTTFVTNSTGIILSWQIKGNNCIYPDYNNVTEDQLKLDFFQHLNEGDKIHLQTKTGAIEGTYVSVSNYGEVIIYKVSKWEFYTTIEFKDILSYRVL